MATKTIMQIEVRLDPVGMIVNSFSLSTQHIHTPQLSNCGVPIFSKEANIIGYQRREISNICLTRYPNVVAYITRYTFCIDE